MDAKAERVYAGAQALLERIKGQFGARALPEEIFQIQDLLECIEKNADRIAHMMKDPKRKRSGESWEDIKGLLVEQDRFFKEVMELFRQLGTKKVAITINANGVVP